MFITNKYKKWYDSIIEIAQSRITTSGYTETHHILPKCMGGDDSFENLVILTAREHFLCHVLLTKCSLGESKYKLIFAANMMCQVSRTYQHRYVNARLYEMIKKEVSKAHSKVLSGRKLSEEHKQKISIGNQGRISSPETIEKRSRSCTGLKRTDEQKKRMRQAQLNRKQKTQEEKKSIAAKISKAKLGKKLGPKSEDHKQKLSAALKGKSPGKRSEATKQKLRGNKSTLHKEAIANARKGKKMYNNGKESILCLPNEKPEGFILGRLKK